MWILHGGTIMNVRFLSGTNALIGDLILPLTKKPATGFPVAIVTHGWNGAMDSKSGQIIQDKLVASGIAVFRFNFRGHGESGGSLADFSVKNGLKDLKNALQYVKLQSDKIDPHTVMLIGRSIGGSVALMALAEGLGFKCAALLAPRSNFKTAKKGMYTVIKGDLKVINLSMMKSGRSVDFYEIGSKVKIPTLLLHGENDTAIEHEQSAVLSKTSDYFEYELIKGADHQFSNYRELVAEKVAQFAKKHLF